MALLCSEEFHTAMSFSTLNLRVNLSPSIFHIKTSTRPSNFIVYLSPGFPQAFSQSNFTLIAKERNIDRCEVLRWAWQPPSQARTVTLPNLTFLALPQHDLSSSVLHKKISSHRADLPSDTNFGHLLNRLLTTHPRLRSRSPLSFLYDSIYQHFTMADVAKSDESAGKTAAKVGRWTDAKKVSIKSLT